MKYIGFIKEYDNIEESIWFENLPDTTDLSEQQQLRIVTYLQQGNIVLAYMGYFNDLHTDLPIEPFAYLTDGDWMWPSYFAYYIHKFDYKLLEEFINHSERNRYTPTPINSLFKIVAYEHQLIKKINIAIPATCFVEYKVTRSNDWRRRLNLPPL